MPFLINHLKKTTTKSFVQTWEAESGNDRRTKLGTSAHAFFLQVAESAETSLGPRHKIEKSVLLFPIPISFPSLFIPY